MRRRQIYSLALALTLATSSLSGVQPVYAESKPVVVNEMNTAKGEELLSYRAETTGTLEIVVPLANVSENYDGWNVTVIGNSNSYRGTYNPQDQKEDVVVLTQVVPAGEYTIQFSSPATCKINFTPSSSMPVVEQYNDSFENAKLFPLNSEVSGDGKLIAKRKAYYKIEVKEAGLLQIQEHGWENNKVDNWTYSYNVYKVDQNGNRILLDKKKLFHFFGYSDRSSNTVRFYTEPATYYIEVDKWNNYGTDELYQEYRFRTSFVPTTAQREKEENDSYLTATSMPVNEERIGNIEQDTDNDWYYVKLDQASMGMVQMTTPFQEQDDIYEVSLYVKRDGNLIALDTINTKANSMVHTTRKKYLAAGEYYVRVKNGRRAPVLSKVAISEQDYKIKLATTGNQMETPQLMATAITKNDVTKITLNVLNPSACGDSLEIYEKVGNGTWQLIERTDKTVYTKTVIGSKKLFSYRVRAVYKDGNNKAYAYSEFSNEANSLVKSEVDNTTETVIDNMVSEDYGEPEDIMETPTLSITRKGFNQLSISIEDIESEYDGYYVNEIELYEKIGNGKWKLKKTLDQYDAYDSCTVIMKKINQKYQYKARVIYESYDEESDGDEDYIYGGFSEVKSFYFKKVLPKPTFKVKLTSSYGDPAILLTPKKHDYAHGIEILSSKEKEIQDLNLRKYDAIYLYGEGKHTVKIRSYRYVNGKKIYSPWTDAKTYYR